MESQKIHFDSQLQVFNSKDDYTSQDVVNLYNEYAPRYEKECCEDGEYNGPNLTVDYFHRHAQRLGFSASSAILDIGAGTGYVGQRLREGYNYSCVDALDCSQEMLNIAKAKGVYRKLFQSYIGEGHTLPMEDDTYDAVLLSGVVVPGHLKPPAFQDIIRITKSGGLIVNCMREQYMHESADCDVRPTFRQWESAGLWTLVEWAIPAHLKHYKDHDSVVQIYTVN